MLPVSCDDLEPRIHVTRKGNRLAFYVQGQGEPLVLIRGYSNAASMWYPQVPAFRRFFQVITFDNRDTGHSDRIAEPYGIADMAEDTISLMEGLDRGPVHLLGLSMGGMIAQEAALLRPDLVKTLLLAGTTCNSGRGLTRDPEVITLFATLPDGSDEENVRRSLPVFFSPRTLAQTARIDAYVDYSLKQRPPVTTFERHSRALQGFDRCEAIGGLTCPTLIQHGGADRLLPPENARELHEKISGSELKLYEGLGHLFLMEDPDTFNQDALNFLAGHSGSR